LKHSIHPQAHLDQLTEGILRGDRVLLGQAITLVESKLEKDALLAETLLEKVLHKTGNAFRIGITGAPGAGKSTFIEALGTVITGSGKKLAVLTIDPSSQLTKGSILGDKTRMEQLSKNEMAFIRPTASSGTLGGVAGKTREAMLLCEAAGYEIVIVETVGVGQSEVAVKDMVDFFLLLMLAGAGDELQGMKKGIIELTDAMVIAKADGENRSRASEAQAVFQQAFHFLPPSPSGWKSPVLLSSALHSEGIEEVWKLMLGYETETKTSGFFEQNRRSQRVSWFKECFAQELQQDIESIPALRAAQKDLERAVMNAAISTQVAARKLLGDYFTYIRESGS